MINSKIGVYQAFILLFLCRMFDVITFSPLYSNNKESIVPIMSSAISFTLTLLMILPIIILHRKLVDEGLDIIDTMMRYNKIVGYTFFAIYFYTATISVALSIVKFKDFMINAIDSFTGIFVIITIFVAALYAAKMGLEGLARAGGIIFVFFVLSIILILFSSLKDVNFVNLKPIVEAPMESMIRFTMATLTNNLELVGLILLFPRIKGNYTKVSIIYVVFTGLFGIITGAVMVLLLGDYLLAQVYPFLTIASIMELGDTIQRLDSVHITIWVALAFVKISFYMVVVKELFYKILPMPQKKNSIYFVGAITVVLLVAINKNEVYNPYFKMPMFTWIPIVSAMFVLPIVALCIKLVRDKKSKSK